MRIPRFFDRLVTKAKPLVPEKAWPALRGALSVPGDRPLVGLPAFRRAVVLAPHPDDESIGPGGTIALLTEAGTAVTVVVLTDGSATWGTGLPAEEVAARRRQETARSCARLGCGPPQFLGFPDGVLSERLAELAGALATVIGDAAPDVVVLPWFGDGHPDHRAVTSALSRTRPPGGVQVWAYETWVPLPANRLVDVTAVIGRKEAALGEHRTASAAFDVTAMLGLNRFRSVHGLAGHGFAEAFLVGPSDRYLKLAADCSRQTLPLSGPSSA